MVAFRVLVAAVMVCVAAAHDCDTKCASPVTLTVTETVCATPGVPVITSPAVSIPINTPTNPSYEAPPPAPPATSVDSMTTPPASGSSVSTATFVPPGPPAETGVPPASGPPVSGSPAVPPSSGIETSAASATGTTSVRTSATHHSSATSAPPVSTAGAVLAVPTHYIDMGSLLAAGALIMAVAA